MLTISNCRKNIGGFHLEIDQLDIPDSGFCILVGPNGSGKSTLFGILSGRDLDYEGKFALDGRELAKNELQDYADTYVAYCPQDSLIFDDETALWNVLLPYPRRNKKEALAILSALGLSNVAKSKAQDLSSGEKQRLSIARALYSKRPVLIFDEPFSLLDSESRDKAVKALVEASKSALVIVSTNEEIPSGLLEGANVGRIEMEKGRVKSARFPEDAAKVSNPPKLNLGFFSRLLDIFKFNRVFYSFFLLASACLLAFTMFEGIMCASSFGTVFDEPPLGYSYSYERLLYSENSPIFNFSNFNGEPEGDPVIMKISSATAENGNTDISIEVLLASMDFSFPTGDTWILDEKEMLVGGWPSEEKTIAVPSGLASLWFGREKEDDLQSFLGRRIKINGSVYSVCGVFDGPIPEWGGELYHLAHGGYEGEENVIFNRESFFAYCSDFLFAVIDSGALSFQSNYYPSTPGNRESVKNGHYIPLIGFLADKDNALSKSPMDRFANVETYYWFNGFYVVLLFVLSFAYCLSNRRRYLLLRFGGMERKRIIGPMLSCFAIAVFGGLTLGIVSGVVSAFIAQAVYLSNRLIPGVSFLSFGYSPFLVNFLFSLLAFLLAVGLLFLFLLRKDLSRELRRIKEK